MQIQHRYYAGSARGYDEMHAAEERYLGVSLSYLSTLLRQFRLRTVLDLGWGIGRAMLSLASLMDDNRSEVAIYGVEPIPELLSIAVN